VDRFLVERHGPPIATLQPGDRAKQPVRPGQTARILSGAKEQLAFFEQPGRTGVIALGLRGIRQDQRTFRNGKSLKNL